MPIGGSGTEVQLTMSADDAFDATQKALAEIGKVREANQSDRRVKGSIRYGLQRVLVKAHVQESGGQATVTLKAQGDDVWGVAAKKVLSKWANAVEGKQ